MSFFDTEIISDFRCFDDIYSEIKKIHYDDFSDYLNFLKVMYLKKISESVEDLEALYQLLDERI